MEKRTKNKGAKYAPLIISPLAVAAAVLLVFRSNGLFPFGDRTASWCDMNQQVVPLLCQFKDILDGKSGMFLSFKNSSGMNFWGVFFFFLASPFSLLVKFVDKSDMLLFVNLLILLKMMTAAVTSSLYFTVSRQFKHLDCLSITALGFMYSVSGYVMLFYQNVIWLDMMYLFPLLIISLERLRYNAKPPLMYILVMAAMITVNYYIGYMIVVFVLLFAAAYIIFFSKSANEPVGAVCRRFLVGSVYSALITAVIWLPCFLQYLSSGRKTSVIENLRTSGFITDYCTVFPIILCGAFPLMCSAADVIFTKKRTSHHKLWLCMFILLSVPLVIEPVNKMWHTGSYMSFPARYAFMTVFAAVILTAYRLDKAYSYDYGKSGQGKITAVAAAVCLAVIAVYGVSTARYIDENIDIISDYTQTLSGSSASFEKICKVAAAAVICFGVIYFCYRRRFLPRRIFLLFLCAALITESMGYVRIYMTTAGIRSEETNAIQRSVFNLADKIDDDGFYRVKTNAKIFDYNMIGAMGYNSVGHYTSLTNENYMFNMKRLGYTSVWMEVGTCGGTELTDALLSIGYEISNTAPDEDREEIYSYGGYYISKTKCSLPLGIAVSENIGEEIPDDMTRAEIQQYLFEEIFGRDEQLIYGYEPAEGGYEYDSEDGYSVGEEEQLIYRIDVNGSQTLYFDCFDKLSNELTEPIYDSFSVSVNGKTVCADYPYSKENGVLKLGEFTDERVIVEINTLKDVSCASFGVFGLDTDLLEEKCSETESVGFSEKTNGLVATCESENPQTVLLAVPYDTGFDIKVNGESVAYRKALSGFIAFEIPEGSADIDISFKPTGFTAGAIISVCGVLTTAVYIITAKVKSKKQEKDGGNLKTDKNSGNIFAVAVFAMGTAAFLIVYLFPTVINMLLWKSK